MSGGGGGKPGLIGKKVTKRGQLVVGRNRYPITVQTEDVPEFTWGSTMPSMDAVHLKSMLVAMKHFRLIILRHVGIEEKMDLGREYRSFHYALDKVKPNVE